MRWSPSPLKTSFFFFLKAERIRQTFTQILAGEDKAPPSPPYSLHIILTSTGGEEKTPPSPPYSLHILISTGGEEKAPPSPPYSLTHHSDFNRWRGKDTTLTTILLTHHSDFNRWRGKDTTLTTILLTHHSDFNRRRGTAKLRSYSTVNPELTKHFSWKASNGPEYSLVCFDCCRPGIMSC